MIYEIYIKSHNPYLDYENQIEAKDEDEAVNKFYDILRGEFDKKFIRNNIMTIYERNS